MAGGRRKEKERKGRKKRNREKKFMSKTITLYYFSPPNMFIKLRPGVII